jgi:serine/threonine protein kinase
MEQLDAEQLQKELKKRQSDLFLQKNGLEEMQVASGTQLQQGEKLGEGGFGVVHAGTYGTHDVVTKTPTQRSSAKVALREEVDAAKGLKEAARAKIQEPENRFADQQGLDLIALPESQFVTLPSGDKAELQKRIFGKDGKSAIFKKEIPFYSSGYPAEPQHATEMVAQLFLGLNTLHSHGRVHSDLKLENVMLDTGKGEERSNAPILKIIDVGEMVPVGSDVVGKSKNAAPEVEFDTPAATTDDIWTAGTCFPVILFGSRMERFYWSCFSFRDTDFKSQLEHMNLEARVAYFRKEFTAANDEMQQATGKSYPADVVNLLAVATAKCLSPKEERPEAKTLADIFTALAYSDWQQPDSIAGLLTTAEAKELFQDATGFLPTPTTAG